MASKAVRKIIHHKNLLTHIKNNNQVLIITADNLQANNVKAIRQGLNSVSSTIVMGKNTMLKRSIAVHAPETGHDAFLGLIPHITGKVGLVFTGGDPDYVGETIASDYKLQPLLCSSMDIGVCSFWQWVLIMHFDLVSKSNSV